MRSLEFAPHRPDEDKGTTTDDIPPLVPPRGSVDSAQRLRRCAYLKDKNTKDKNTFFYRLSIIELKNDTEITRLASMGEQ